MIGHRGTDGFRCTIYQDIRECAVFWMRSNCTISVATKRERDKGGREEEEGMQIILDKSDRELFVMPDFYGLAEDLLVSCLS